MLCEDKNESDNSKNMENALRMAEDFSHGTSRKKKTKHTGDKPIRANPVRGNRNLLK